MSLSTTTPQKSNADSNGLSDETGTGSGTTMAETTPTTVHHQQQAISTTSDRPKPSQSQSTVLPSAVEFEPPLACIRRILKNALPSSTNVGKDASATFARASGIFIMYLTACANDFARENKRQTITANDVLAAMKVCLYIYIYIYIYTNFGISLFIVGWLILLFP
jgi:histone H3/H4